MIESVRCEVLNASYEPLSIISGRRGLVLYLKGKAEILSEHPSYEVRSDNDIHPIPTQVRLFTMVKGRPTTRTPAQLTNRNLFIRDRYTCQYCGRARGELKNSEFLTRDHVHPQDKGGPDIWGNVVTACNKCNNKKANLTLEELAMMGVPLRFVKGEDWKPHKPTVFEIWSKSFSKKSKHN